MSRGNKPPHLISTALHAFIWPVHARVKRLLIKLTLASPAPAAGIPPEGSADCPDCLLILPVPDRAQETRPIPVY